MTYITTVMADAPLHFWRFADGGGQIAHDIGSVPFHLIASQANMLGYSGPNSDGGAGFFPTGQDFNSVSRNLQSVTSPFSADMWYWMFALPAGQVEPFAWDNYINGVAMIFNNAGQYQPGVTGTYPATAPASALQTWHHVALTYDGATLKGYIDGAVQNTVAKVGPVTIARQLGIGSDPNNFGVSFEGFLSEPAIYGTALSALQVANHYAAADQRTQAPVYIAVAGNQGVTGVSGGAGPPGMATILSGLSRVWQNTP